MSIEETERVDTVIVGGGQGGLATAYHLKRLGREPLILDAHGRVGDAWRNRWDSLRLFTYARYSGLPGMRIPAAGWSFPTKDEMADYLEAYASRFDLEVRTGVTVDRLTRAGDRFVLSAGGSRFEARNVVVATGPHRVPRVPTFASELDPSIHQMHSSEYLRPSQLRPGGVLLVGAGNSGGDIALEVVREHPTWLSGRDTGHVPVPIDSRRGHIGFRVFRFLMHHVVTIRTPIGRRAMAKHAGKGDPLVRVKPKDLLAVDIERVPPVAGVRDGRPVLTDGTVLDVANVIWCTGFGNDFSWIDLPIFGGDGMPLHDRGVVCSAAGLFFVGLPFQYAASSTVLPGIGRDHAYVARRISERAASNVGDRAPVGSAA
jgi:putative flavoprotein involved in K+ transport